MILSRKELSDTHVDGQEIDRRGGSVVPDGAGGVPRGGVHTKELISPRIEIKSIVRYVVRSPVYGEDCERDVRQEGGSAGWEQSGSA